ncbi:YybH family protein [Falsiroseomonas sp. HC035]|uniref:YybH family protein n=1 Tax=Falsiroseomonas sp. HC035 TaxID=3390999 RepID=UPI003D323AF4
MSMSRRSTLAAAGTTLLASPDAFGDDLAAGLAHCSAEANAALMRGDVQRYLELVTLADEFTLMSPFGGPASRAASFTPERWEAVGKFFAKGTLRQEVVQTYAAADMVVLVLIERSHVEVGGLPAQDWALRVTLVYCRVDDAWRLAHRHADPLAPGISLQQAAKLARGEAA